MSSRTSRRPRAALETRPGFFYGKISVKVLRLKYYGGVPASPRLVGLGPKRLNTNMYYVYILKSRKTGKLYKGFTEDLKDRLARHNRGETLSTKSGMPWELIYYEAFSNKSDALREEKFLKSGKGKERIKYLFLK